MLSSNHLSGIVSLAKSMTVKLHGSAVSMNKQLFEKLNVTYDSNDLTTWAYYKNISGLPHDANTTITFIAIEDNSEVELTKDNLERYSKTNRELSKFEDYYTNLVSEYPGQELYIRGIMNPVDIDVAINAVEGTILSHSHSKIEWNEVSLMAELEDEIKLFLSRWNINRYLLTDELYIPALYGALAIFIVNKIFLLRLRAVSTMEVNKRYRDLIFSSNLGIAEYTDMLSDKSSLWLAKNIYNIGFNIGKEETLNSIIDNILTPSGITVREINLIPSISELNDISDPMLALYGKTSPSLFSVSKEDRDSDKSHIDLTNTLKDNVIDTLMYQYSPSAPRRNTLDSATINTKGLAERTKFYVLSQSESTIFPTDLEIDIAIETTILYTAIRNKEETYKYKDPDGNVFDYTGYQLYLLLMYNLLIAMKYDLNGSEETKTFPFTFPFKFGETITSDDLQIHTLRLGSIIKSGFNINSLLKKVTRYTSDGEEAYMDTLASVYNTVSSDTTIPAKDFILEQKRAHAKLIICASNTGNAIRTAELNYLRKCVIDDTEYSIENVDDIIEELLDKKVIRNLDDNMLEIASIVETITGISITAGRDSEVMLGKVKELVSRLTSYTITSIVDTNTSDVLVPGDGVSLIGDANIIKIVSGSADCEGSVADIVNTYGDDAVPKVQVLYSGELGLEDIGGNNTPTIFADFLEDDKVHVLTPSLIIT